MNTMTDNELEVLFRSWWALSYPTPPGNHAITTHISFGRWLLQQQAEQQQREQER